MSIMSYESSKMNNEKKKNGCSWKPVAAVSAYVSLLVNLEAKRLVGCCSGVTTARFYIFNRHS